MFERSRRMHGLLLSATAWVILWALPVQAASPSSPSSPAGAVVSGSVILPGNVLARLESILDDLETIRVEMGRPKEQRPVGSAHGTAPHEAYFQALTLYLKADRLALELTGSTGFPPTMANPRQIQVRDIAEVVTAAHQRLRIVMRELGLMTDASSGSPNPRATLTDVGYAILRANRQLNLLLERRFTPSDSYQQVTLAIGYADALLSRFPDATPAPPAPPFERGKTPGDVFARLLKSYQRLQTIAASANLTVLQIDSVATHPADVLPSDVYDLATLLVSDLAYFHAQGRAPRQPEAVPYHGRKFPSHVYQQAGVLDDRLALLERLITQSPGWLTR